MLSYAPPRAPHFGLGHGGRAPSACFLGTKECLGIERLEQLTAPETVRLMRAVSLYYFVTADDPPVYLSHTRPATPVTRQSSPLKWVHHAEFGLRLQAALRGQGVEAVVHYRHGPHPVYRDGVEFVAEKFAARR